MNEWVTFRDFLSCQSPQGKEVLNEKEVPVDNEDLFKPDEHLQVMLAKICSVLSSSREYYDGPSSVYSCQDPTDDKGSGTDDFVALAMGEKNAAKIRALMDEKADGASKGDPPMPKESRRKSTKVLEEFSTLVGFLSCHDPFKGDSPTRDAGSTDAHRLPGCLGGGSSCS